MKFNKTKIILFALFMLLPFLALSDSRKIEIRSTPISEDEMPEPRRSMTLVAELLNTKDTSIVLKALVTIDGTLMTALPGKIILNERDIPEYTFTINAPVNDISYQFIAFPEDAPSVVSKRFTVTRSCVTDLSFASSKGQEDLEGEDLLAALIDQASKLDNEANLYAESTKIAKRIKTVLKEIEP